MPSQRNGCLIQHTSFKISSSLYTLNSCECASSSTPSARERDRRPTWAAAAVVSWEENNNGGPRCRIGGIVAGEGCRKAYGFTSWDIQRVTFFYTKKKNAKRLSSFVYFMVSLHDVNNKSIVYCSHSRMPHALYYFVGHQYHGNILSDCNSGVLSSPPDRREDNRTINWRSL